MSPLRRFLPLAAAALVGFVAPAHAEVFVFKDWVVGCDNTGGCEAAGFRAAGSASQPVMLWIARAAGAGTPVRGRLKVETPQGTRTGPFRLLVADHVRVSAPLDGDLDAADCDAPRGQGVKGADVAIHRRWR